MKGIFFIIALFAFIGLTSGSIEIGILLGLIAVGIVLFCIMLDERKTMKSIKRNKDRQQNKKTKLYSDVDDYEERFARSIRSSKKAEKDGEGNLWTAYGQIEMLNALKGTDLNGTALTIPKTFLYAMTIYAMKNSEFRKNIKAYRKKNELISIITSRKHKIINIGAALYKDKFEIPDWLQSSD